ncbi:MAG: fibronectin type III domain-containing protein [Deltaproteobacteria bacterium]|nr:fibronectin type III domain-containing protein [Deltaproteobacteria bacterium]
MKSRIYTICGFILMGVLFCLPCGLALTTADLPGPGAELVIEADNSLIVNAGQNAHLEGTLIVRGTEGSDPVLTIENHGEFVFEGMIRVEQATLELTNFETGTIKNTEDVGQDFLADAGCINIDNRGSIEFIFLPESESRTLLSAGEDTVIQLVNSGALTITNLMAEAAEGGEIGLQHASGVMEFVNFSVVAQATVPDACSHFNFDVTAGEVSIDNFSLLADTGGSAAITTAGGDIFVNNLALQASGDGAAVLDLQGDHVYFSNFSLGVSGNGAVEIINATDCEVNNSSIHCADSSPGIIILNNAEMHINSMNCQAYAGNIRIENTETIEMNNVYMKSQDDAEALGNYLKLLNHGNVWISNITLVANGATGLIELVNDKNLTINNMAADSNYGGTIKICNLAGEMNSNNCYCDSSGASHGKISEIDLLIDGGTCFFDDTSIVNNGGLMTLRSSVGVLFDNINIDLQNKAEMRLLNQSGDMIITNLGGTILGQGEDVSTLTVWNNDTLTVAEEISLECNDEILFDIYPFEAGVIYTLLSECGVTEKPQAFAPWGPDPEIGDSGIRYDLVVLSWQGGHPQGDAVSYNLYLDTQIDDTCLLCREPVATGLVNPSYILTSLEPNTTYYWQVVAYTEAEIGIEGPKWSFTTGDGTVSPEEDKDNDDDDDDSHCFILEALRD